MQSIHLIRENLQRSEEIVLSRVEEMRDHCLVLSTPRGGCHTLWVLGHLAYIEALVIHTFMLGKPHPLAAWEEWFDGAEVCNDIEHFLPFDRALAECRAIRASTISLLHSLDEDDLDRMSEGALRGS